MPAGEIQTTFAAIVDHWATERAGEPALADEAGARLGWGDLAELVRQTREDLRALGIGPRDRVAVAMPPGPRSAALFTALACSVTIVPLLPGLPQPELMVLLPRLGLAAAIRHGREGADPLAAAAATIGIPVIQLRPPAGDPFRFRLEGPLIGPPDASGAPGPDDPGVIIATSGTTGRPKLVQRTHGQLAGLKRGADPLLPAEPDWTTILLSPLALSLGMTSLRRSVAAGGMAVAPEKLGPSRLAALAGAFDPAWIFAAPQAFAELAEATAAGWRPGPSLRYLRCTSARLDPAVREALPVPVYDAYASTEAGMVAREGFGVPHRPGFVGRIEARVRIVEEGRILPEGAAGEIEVSGPRVFTGYLDDPEATARAFSDDGWYRTGDLGYVEDGYLALLGRLDDQINLGGLKLDPETIERALAGWPGIVEAAAFGAPHPQLGQQAAAAVVLAPGADLDLRALRRWLIERLGPHAVPKRIDVVDSLPRTPNGKVSRSRLAAASQPDGPS